jgi:hypothetical protein
MEMNAGIHTQSSSPALVLKYYSYVILFFLKILELLNPKFHHRNHHGVCAGGNFFLLVLTECTTPLFNRYSPEEIKKFRLSTRSSIPLVTT